jgi:hypothetical protein
MMATIEVQVHHLALKSPEQYYHVTVHRCYQWEHQMAVASPEQWCLHPEPPCYLRVHKLSVVALVQEYLLHDQC